MGKVIKVVRSDQGGEYYGKHGNAGQLKGPFAKYLEDSGIVAQFTMPGSPEQNGVVLNSLIWGWLVWAEYGPAHNERARGQNSIYI